MHLDEIITLLPCHSLEDFPLYLEDHEADSLLGAWSAAWHPALLAAAGRAPTWRRADDPPTELSGRLLFIPETSQRLIPAGWVDRATSEGAAIVQGGSGRAEMVRAALAQVVEPPVQVDSGLADDFLALGFCYLLVELLTRQMRYMSNLDEVHFQSEAVKAAKAVVSGGGEEARGHLRRCFDVLAESRERFYPVDSYLLDLTLCAPTTIGKSLRDQLQLGQPVNLLLAAEVLDELADREPSTLDSIRDAIRQGCVSIVGGEYREGELSLMDLESILRELMRGLATYEKLVDRRPRVFGRRRAGLTPVLPQILYRLGFHGALHITLDDGHFPRVDQSRSRWEGVDGSVLDIFARLPLDANQSGSFLSLPAKLGESMDLDHVATVAFVHWPGAYCPWYSDLWRASAYAPILGKFITLDDYFEETDTAGRLSRFDVDQYRAPYLAQRVAGAEADALSRYADVACQQAAQLCLQTIETLVALIRGKPRSESSRAGPGDELKLLGDTAAAASDGRLIEERLRAATRDLAGLMAAKNGDDSRALFVINPLSFRRHVVVDISALPTRPADCAHVIAYQEDEQSRTAVVEVPAMGFVCVASAGEGQTPADPISKASKTSKPLAEEHTLRNDFFELTLDETTGGIRSLRCYEERGNRLSQQIAIRSPGPRAKPGDLWRDPDEAAVYSIMAADSIEVQRAGPAVGAIQCRGRMLDQTGIVLARFAQTITTWRRSRILLVDIELDMEESLQKDPWNSYCAARFAWADIGAELRRSVAHGAHTTEAKRVEAPDFFEIALGTQRTAILPGGLPFHRRVSDRMLDVLLAVRGETHRRFRLGIGVDLPSAAQGAIELICPALSCVATHVSSAEPPSGWFFHLDSPRVVATHWEPLVEEGHVRGFRVRLLETLGRAGHARLRAFRPLASARQIDFHGQTLVELPIEDDAIRVDLNGHEWAQVEAQWQLG